MRFHPFTRRRTRLVDYYNVLFKHLQAWFRDAFIASASVTRVGVPNAYFNLPFAADPQAT